MSLLSECLHFVDRHVDGGFGVQYRFNATSHSRVMCSGVQSVLH